MKGKLLVFLLVLLADQLTKYIAYTHLAVGESQVIIPGLFNFTLVYNPGAAFGMFSSLTDGVRRVTLGLVSVLALIVVLRFMTKEAKHDIISQYALVGILAGAFGNIIDRGRFDSVVDFLDFYYQHYHWPAFNVADSAISVGVAVLMLRVLFAKEPGESTELPAAGMTPG